MAENAVAALLAKRSPSGVWEGRLSSSALSTATAVIALSFDEADSVIVSKGRRWLIDSQNEDGGWGDTTASLSNISTTALCWAALPSGPASERAEKWLTATAGSTDPQSLKTAIAKRYGKDRTFSVPILTALAIGGRLGPDAWRIVPQLPFELAACPHEWFRFLRLPVVSYALPALIGIGLARHRRAPSRNPLLRVPRSALTSRVLRILEVIQPGNGGFLEATPLTSFVAMSLIAAGFAQHLVTQKCLAFLRGSVREDGSWPIDTNLSTWITTLAIDGVAGKLSETDRAKLRDWLLSQQFQQEHPYTHAAPGAWSWTNLPGAVPDADDTAGALLALKKLGGPDDLDAVTKGVRWLLDLQNRDGGMPTFCKGWGTLPFDRSGPDLTAHAIRAWRAWLPLLPSAEQERISLAIRKALAYLRKSQQADGSWIPLWFGNQQAPRDENRTFGTARVILALRDCAHEDAALKRGIDWLVRAQNADGGWGGSADSVSSIEETALAVGSLAEVVELHPESVTRAIESGLNWLRVKTANGTTFPSTPIGFYFASLWYFEELYPLVFTVTALHRVLAKMPLGDLCGLW